MISFLLYKDQKPAPAAENGSQGSGDQTEERKEILGETSDKEAGEEVKEETLVSPVKGESGSSYRSQRRDLCLRNAGYYRCGRAFRGEDHRALRRTGQQYFRNPDMPCALPQKQGENC